MKNSVNQNGDKNEIRITWTLGLACPKIPGAGTVPFIIAYKREISRYIHDFARHSMV